MTKEQWLNIYNNDYIGRQMSLPQLAKLYGLGSTTIHRNFKKYGLDRRTHSEKSIKYNINSNFFDCINSEEKAYFLGLMYSDGYISDNMFGIALKSDDVDILEKFKKAMQSEHPIHFYTNNGYGGTTKSTEYCRLLIRNRHIVEQLIDKGVVYRKSKILKHPILSPDLIRHFIRGYLDGDGSIYESSNSVTVSFTGTENVLTYIMNYFIDNKLMNRTKLHPEHNSDTIFSLKIGGNIQSRRILNELYKDANFYLERKHNKYLQIINK